MQSSPRKDDQEEERKEEGRYGTQHKKNALRPPPLRTPRRPELVYPRAEPAAANKPNITRCNVPRTGANSALRQHCAKQGGRRGSEEQRRRKTGRRFKHLASNGSDDSNRARDGFPDSSKRKRERGLWAALPRNPPKNLDRQQNVCPANVAEIPGRNLGSKTPEEGGGFEEDSRRGHHMLGARTRCPNGQ